MGREDGWKNDMGEGRGECRGRRLGGMGKKKGRKDGKEKKIMKTDKEKLKNEE